MGENNRSSKGFLLLLMFLFKEAESREENNSGDIHYNQRREKRRSGDMWNIDNLTNCQKYR